MKNSKTIFCRRNLQSAIRDLQFHLQVGIYGLLLAALSGCEESKLPVQDEFRGNPISGEVSGVLGTDMSPYLAVDTLRVPQGQSLTIMPGVELRFEPGIPFIVDGVINAVGSEAAPIVFTSGLKFPSRGDWDGIWLVDSDARSRFSYCRFHFGAKYGAHYNYRSDNTGSVVDSTVFEYGSVTLFRSSPTIDHCWFVAGGFHGVHADSGSSPSVTNCVFYDNAGNGIYVASTANPEIRYNIIIENNDWGIFCREDGEVIRADLNLWYNVIWSNFSGEYSPSSPSLLRKIDRANGNLDSCNYQYNLRLNPGFIDPENGDFRLNPCSAAIDAGPEDDGPRDPDGTRIELGIYAYNYAPGEIRRRIPNPPRTGNTLTAAGSPYRMTCDILIPAGETLTVEPGVQILVDGRFVLRARGNIMMNGSQNSPVVMSAASANPSRGDWVGIVLESDGDGSSSFSHTQISYARWGIRLNKRDADITDCIISNCDSIGIFCYDNATAEIERTALNNNSIAGIACLYNSSPLIRNCRITGGAGYGIMVSDYSNPTIRNNVINGVGTNGIRLQSISNASIINNTIAFNGYYGLSCENNSSPLVLNNIFYKNGDDIRGGIGIYATSTSSPDIRYNDLFGHRVSSVEISGDRTAIDMDLNYAENPGFVNEAAGDFHLQAGSPCRDKGHPDAEWNDLDGSRNDLGAFGGPFGE